jgi:hypothetical protein
MSIWEGVSHLLPESGRREFTADEALAVEIILDAAQHYADGKLPWWEAANQGEVVSQRGYSTGYGRFLALCWALANNDPRLPALRALIDELVFQSGITVTRFGIIDVEELHQHNITVRGAAA